MHQRYIHDRADTFQKSDSRNTQSHSHQNLSKRLSESTCTCRSGGFVVSFDEGRNSDCSTSPVQRMTHIHMELWYAPIRA